MIAQVENLLKKVFGSSNDRALKKIQPLVDRVNGLEPKMKGSSDDELRALTAAFKRRLDAGEPLDNLLPEAFAGVREVSRRVMGMRHFDVQLIGGIVLHQGKVAEMKTGEGKTLVATLPVYLNALEGKGVHVVTVNDYLASRDADWMSPIYNFLGLSVGKILSNERNDQTKRAAYASDVTYGTNNEFGFDYLRDNMKFRAEQYVQRGHNFAIVDEVDSILIDEARTPLIISGPVGESVEAYYLVDAVIPMLQLELDYTVDEKNRQVHLTDDGVDKLEKKLGVDNLYDPHNLEVLHHVNQALRAHTLFKRDRDYVVEGGQVVIIDEHTGRKMHGRRWSDGLHQAVEAKERLKVQEESQTYATITFQNLFRMYKKLAGMTGTAETEAAEFHNIYKLDVAMIPTNLPIRRRDEDDIVYRTQEEKFGKVIEDIESCHSRGQPVLVGTTSVEKSEIVSRMLTRKGIPHELLNAKQHEREGHIVAQAGRIGAVTISTNMAGRGTDIKLGGNPDALAKDAANPLTDPAEYEAALAQHRARCEAERKRVLEVGGLRIIGTERHESRRIDNQLRGRSGRQGDPGSSKFYLSLEDDLLRIFGSDKILAWMDKMGIQDDEPIQHRWITSSIENAQKRVEGQNFNMRKNLLEYDDVLNQQRKIVYEVRRKALTGEAIRDMVIEAIDGVVDDIMDDCVVAGVRPDEWDIPGLRERLNRILGIQWSETDEELRDTARLEIQSRMLREAKALFEAKEQELSVETSNQIARQLLLQFTDQLWKDHLLAMDRLRDGVSLRGYGQRNPLLEYKKEGFNMFLLMTALRDEAVISRILRVKLQAPPDASEAIRQAIARQGGNPAVLTGDNLADEDDVVDASFGGDDGMEAPEPSVPGYAPAEPAAPPPPPRLPAMGAEARAVARAMGIRRNDPCPCGSGKKFKKCCYSPDDDGEAEEAVAAAPEQAAEAQAPVESSVEEQAAEPAAPPEAESQADADTAEQTPTDEAPVTA
ncbi:MAG: preprotein translocase subunit SecA [Deltaproteobacteria bacterium]|nr:preprotein translocase subunit SecA [Deltaproteobacteria bacterium]